MPGDSKSAPRTLLRWRSGASECRAFFAVDTTAGFAVMVGAVTSLADVEIDGRWQGEKPGFARGGFAASS